MLMLSPQSCWRCKMGFIRSLWQESQPNIWIGEEEYEGKNGIYPEFGLESQPNVRRGEIWGGNGIYPESVVRIPTPCWERRKIKENWIYSEIVAGILTQIGRGEIWRKMGFSQNLWLESWPMLGEEENKGKWDLSRDWSGFLPQC